MFSGCQLLIGAIASQSLFKFYRRKLVAKLLYDQIFAVVPRKVSLYRIPYVFSDEEFVISLFKNVGSFRNLPRIVKG